MVTGPDSFPFMVIGNKSDMDDHRAVSTEAAEKIVRDIGPDIEHIETSAKDNKNVN